MESSGGLWKTIRDSLLIMVFEFLGTGFLCLLYSMNGAQGNFSFPSLLLGIFVLIIFAAKISGSHYNPAVTLAFMFRKDTGRFSRILGISYIIFQLAGAFCGSLIYLLLSGDGGNLAVRSPVAENVVQCMIAEAVGAFFLAFLYLTQTEEKTKLSKDPAITALIIAASYVASLKMSQPPNRYLACLNPAIGVSTTIVMAFGGEGAEGVQWIWLYGGFPFIGAIVAVLFHEFVYKKVVETIEESEQNDEGILDKTI